MSTGYSWEGIRQVRVTLLQWCATALHVPERLCGGLCLLGAIYQVLDLYFFYLYDLVLYFTITVLTV